MDREHLAYSGIYPAAATVGTQSGRRNLNDGGGGMQMVGNNAQVTITPIRPRYIHESVHILPYSSKEYNAWGEKWANRKRDYFDLDGKRTGGYMEDKGTLEDFLLGQKGPAFLSEHSQRLYQKDVSYPYQDTDKMRFEIYHPSTFETSRNRSNNERMPLGAIRQLIPKVSAKQIDFESNDKEHTRRLEIAAKAALMLYRGEKENDIKVVPVLAPALNIAKRERNTAKLNYDLSLSNPSAVRQGGWKAAYNVAQESVASIVAPSLQLTNEVFSAVTGMKTASDDLPASLDSIRNASCYGLWGKWYDRSTGFHRGIDITFGENNIIYSICCGTVVALKRSSFEGLGDSGKLSYLVVRTDDNQYLTYMHAKFDDLRVNQVIDLGTRIGIEKDYMDGKRAYHTHIELNCTHPAPPPRHNAKGFAQSMHPSEEICSKEPYGFLEACFRSFYDTIIEANR